MKLRYKRIFFIVAIPLLLGGLLHYTLSYKIKNILELIVEKQSNNTYSFHAKKIEISLWNKNLLVEDAQLISSDSGIAKTHYTIEIPQMTMKIESWTKMIFNQTLSINHVSFTDSKIHIHEKSVNKIKTNIDLQHALKAFENILVF